MTDEEKLQMLKQIVGEGYPESMLSTYLTLAAQKIIRRAYPYDNTVTAVPSQYEALQVEIAAYLIEKRGAEGETAHSENGISRTYESADVPESLIGSVTPYCGVVS